MKNNKFIKILFVIYCVLIVWIILFKLSFSINDLSRYRSINLIPFYYDREVSFHFSEVFNNILIFIPFGIYLKMLNTNTKKTVLYGFIFSIILESLQYILGIGATDVTDIITNTLGTFVGACSYCLLVIIFNREEEIKEILSILATICTILLISLLFLLIM